MLRIIFVWFVDCFISPFFYLIFGSSSFNGSLYIRDISPLCYTSWIAWPCPPTYPHSLSPPRANISGDKREPRAGWSLPLCLTSSKRTTATFFSHRGPGIPTVTADQLPSLLKDKPQSLEHIRQLIVLNHEHEVENGRLISCRDLKECQRSPHWADSVVPPNSLEPEDVTFLGNGACGDVIS